MSLTLPRQCAHNVQSSSVGTVVDTLAGLSGVFAVELEVRRHRRLTTRVVLESEVSQITPFDDVEFRDWMAEATGLPDGFPQRVATLGSEPFSEEEFDSFLQELGVEVFEPDTDLEVVFVGRTGWSQLELLRIVQNRAETTLMVFSQEIALAYIFSGQNPFDEDEALLRRMGEGHPALTFLSNLGFDWPTTEAFGGGRSEVDGDWPEVGLLSHMNYRVGKTAGKPQPERRRILRRLFEAESLPQVKNSEYMREWGAPTSKTRLRKLANSIAAFCRNEKRRPNPPWAAIKQREEDLAWLKAEFYDGRFDFGWPST